MQPRADWGHGPLQYHHPIQNDSFPTCAESVVMHTKTPKLHLGSRLPRKNVCANRVSCGDDESSCESRSCFDVGVSMESGMSTELGELGAALNCSQPLVLSGGYKQQQAEPNAVILNIPPRRSP